MGTTLAEKVWADHLVRKGSDGAPDLLYIDLMLMHEVTSPQAFEGLRLAGRKPRHIDQLIATEDHNTPTVDIDRPNPDETSALQLSSGTGPYAAGHDHRVRRFAHLHARCVRCDGAWHRHFRGRARHGHADAESQAVQDHGHQYRRRTAEGRYGQRHHSCDYREDWHRRWPGSCHRVPRRGDQEAVDGCPHDDLQHVDRGGCPSRHDCAG